MRVIEDERAHLRQAGAGSEAAFLALVDRHHAGLVRVARLWIDDAEHAEALVQRTWLALLHRLGRFDGNSSLKGWLCGALLREVRMQLGPEHEAAFELNADAHAHAPAVDPERFSPKGDRWEGHWQKPPVPWTNAVPGSAVSADQRGVIEGVLQRLPHGQRVVVLLRDVEGLSSHEVEHMLGANAELQHLLLHRGRSQVRAALERHHAAGAV